MKGLKAANSLLISGGNITINSADDAIHSDVSVIMNGGVFVIASGDDAVHAEDTLTITAGKIEISECYEGLEALHIDVQGGDIRLVASDDGLNAAGGTDQSGTEGGRDGMFGAGHNAFFYTKEGQLMTAFHIQTDPKHPSGDRTVVIGKVKFDVKNNEIFQTIE